MNTKVIQILDPNESHSALMEAAQLIKAGEVVAFPTETVYGLGANALNEKAVRKIFRAKERPADNPLIIHIHDVSQVDLVARNVSETAKLFMDKFWPGPLSLVLKKKSVVPNVTTANLDTVVVRLPSHPVARALIKLSETPIAAPSANTSGKVSPTKAKHVISDLYGKVPMIIDGGSIKYGLESTVVDCTQDEPVILRPGSVTFEDLRKVVPTIKSHSTDSEVRSPGMKYKHYAPNSPITLFVGSSATTARQMSEYLKTVDSEKTFVIWHTGNFSNLPNQKRLPSNQFEAASLLFSTLREVDETNTTEIVVQGYDKEGIGVAIMNRLEKAATNIIEK